MNDSIPPHDAHDDDELRGRIWTRHHHEDEHKGRILSRREALAALGGGALAFLGARAVWGDASPAMRSTLPAQQAATAGSSNDPNQCIARPELTEGPYFVDEKLIRSDIRSDAITGKVKVGVPLELTFNVSRVDGGACSFLPNALVDVWHTDAQGLYSDIGSDGTAGQTFLRGAQMTNAQGMARFQTIYPGWYRGRTVHIHYKIRVANPAGGTYEFTSQLFFDDDVSDVIYTQSAYKRNTRRDQFNDRDGIFREGGEGLILDLQPSGDGFQAAFAIGLDLSKPARGRENGPLNRGGFGRWGDN